MLSTTSVHPCHGLTTCFPLSRESLYVRGTERAHREVAISNERNPVEQRYEAVMAVIRDGRQMTEAGRLYGVTRQTMHA